MERPFVSVVLPTFNRAGLLPRSIRSVLDQTYGDLELLVCDDGSTDETRAVVGSFADPRVRYLGLEENHGQAAARNRGVAAARGDLIAFVDSDDEWLPGYLERHRAEWRDSSDLAVTYCDMIRIWRDGRILLHESPRVETGRLVNPVTRYWQLYGLGIQSAVLQGDAARRNRFDEKLRCLEDLDLFTRLAIRGRFRHIAEGLVRYYQSDGVSGDWRAQLRARQRLLRRHWGVLARQHPRFLVAEAAGIAMGWALRRGMRP